MAEPAEYDRLVDYTYLITTSLYVLVAACGYAMFGSSTMQEITQNLPLVGSYSKALTQFTIWLVALNPVTKYPLAASPINMQIEKWLVKLFPALKVPEKDGGGGGGGGAHGEHSGAPVVIPFALRVITRSAASALICLFAVSFPGFESMMALLGSFFSCTVSIVFPELCYLQLYGHKLTLGQKAAEYVVIAIGLVAGVLGTVSAAMSAVGLPAGEP
ncbi:hypothetical protein HK105_203246 [Polyrhizophydium stewartii]|uniref:Amino acid transporter transmembrane domain-containing protein n=1 Tax=Polyrhizophydium stewartii TaxID=2732419 RepID=A0ABR4NCC1_9FUNG